MSDVHAIGVISDTHGLLRPEALGALAGVERILHAGDVGRPGILDELGRIAPVTAVRGNVDREAWAYDLPLTARFEVAGRRLVLTHDLGKLALDPAVEGFEVVIFGHSHRPRNERAGAVLYFNPGSAGPRRFSLPVTVGRLLVSAAGVHGRILELSP